MEEILEDLKNSNKTVRMDRQLSDAIKAIIGRHNAGYTKLRSEKFRKGSRLYNVVFSAVVWNEQEQKDQMVDFLGRNLASSKKHADCLYGGQFDGNLRMVQVKRAPHSNRTFLQTLIIGCIAAAYVCLLVLLWKLKLVQIIKDELFDGYKPLKETELTSSDNPIVKHRATAEGSKSIRTY